MSNKVSIDDLKLKTLNQFNQSSSSYYDSMQNSLRTSQHKQQQKQLEEALQNSAQKLSHLQSSSSKRNQSQVNKLVTLEQLNPANIMSRHPPHNSSHSNNIYDSMMIQQQHQHQSQSQNKYSESYHSQSNSKQQNSVQKSSYDLKVRDLETRIIQLMHENEKILSVNSNLIIEASQYEENIALLRKTQEVEIQRLKTQKAKEIELINREWQSEVEGRRIRMGEELAEDLKRQMSGIQDKNNLLIQEILDKDAMIETLEGRLKKMPTYDDITMYEGSISNLKSQITELISENQKLCDLASSNAQQTMSQKSKYENLNQSHATKVSELRSQFELQFSQLQVDHQIKMQANEQHIKELMRTIADLEEKQIMVVKQLEREQASRIQSDEQSKKARQVYESQTQQLTEKVQRQDHELSILNRDLEVSRKMQMQKEQEKSISKQENEYLNKAFQQQLSEKEHQLLSKQHECEAMQKKVQMAENANINKQNDISTLMHKLEMSERNFDVQMDSLKQQLGQKDSTIENLDMDFAHLKSKIAQAEQENDQKFSLMRNEYDKIFDDRERVIDDFECMQQRLKESQLVKMEDDKLISALQENLQKMDRNCQDQMHLLRQEMDIQTVKHNNMVQEQVQEFNKSIQHEQFLQREIQDSCEHALQELRVALNDREGQITRLQQSIAQYMTYNQELVNDNNKQSILQMINLTKSQQGQYSDFNWKPNISFHSQQQQQQQVFVDKLKYANSRMHANSRNISHNTNSNNQKFLRSRSVNISNHSGGGLNDSSQLQNQTYRRNLGQTERSISANSQQNRKLAQMSYTTWVKNNIAMTDNLRFVQEQDQILNKNNIINKNILDKCKNMMNRVPIKHIQQIQ